MKVIILLLLSSILTGCSDFKDCDYEQCLIDRMYKYCEENNCEISGHAGSMYCTGRMPVNSVIDKSTRQRIDFNWIQADYDFCESKKDN